MDKSRLEYVKALAFTGATFSMDRYLPPEKRTGGRIPRHASAGSAQRKRRVAERRRGEGRR